MECNVQGMREGEKSAKEEEWKGARWNWLNECMKVRTPARTRTRCRHSRTQPLTMDNGATCGMQPQACHTECKSTQRGGWGGVIGSPAKSWNHCVGCNEQGCRIRDMSPHHSSTHPVTHSPKKRAQSHYVNRNPTYFCDDVRSRSSSNPH